MNVKKYEVYEELIKFLAVGEYEQECAKENHLKAQNPRHPLKTLGKKWFIENRAKSYGAEEKLQEIFDAQTLPAFLSRLNKEFGIQAEPEDTLSELVDTVWCQKRNAVIAEIIRQTEDWEIPPRDIFPFLGYNTMPL